MPCFHRSDINLGNLFTDSTSKIETMIKNNLLNYKNNLPECFGAHCVSLFDNPKFWNLKNE
jgi:hypothetical protein